MPAQTQEIDQQKAALLAAIAQQGQQGQEAFAAEAARRQAQQQAAVQAVSAQSKMSGGPSAPKEFTQSLQQKQNELGSIYAQDAAMSGQTFNNSIAQTSAANAAYMDQARAALPIVNAQTAGTVAQIRAEQQAAEQERAYQAEQRRIDAIEAEKDRTFAEQQRQWEREDRLLNLNEKDTSEEDAKIQAGVVARANAADPIIGAVINDLTADSPDFRTAVVALDGYVKNVLNSDDTGAARKAWNGDKKAKILQLLYKFYDPSDKGDSLSDDRQKMGDYLRSQNLDPTKHVPGYVSESDRARQEAIRSQTPVTRNPARSASQSRTAQALKEAQSLADRRKKAKSRRTNKKRGSDPSLSTSGGRRGPDASGGL